MGTVAMVTGLLVVVDNFASRWIDFSWAIPLLGAIILVTGILHMVGEWQIGNWTKLRVLHFFLGLFEFILGLQLLISPWLQASYAYWTMAFWALLGGVVFIGTAWYQHVQTRRQKRKEKGKKDETVTT